MSDLVERLRAWHTPGETITGDVGLYLEAADRIEALEAALEESWNIRKYIDFLRADESDSVTIFCDNPDFNGQPNCAIECNGYWTNWQDRRFAGETIEASLELAYFECRQWRENPPPDVSPDPRARAALAPEQDK